MDVETYERALKRTREVVVGTTRDRFDDATPCPDWSVRDLLNHIIGGCRSYAAGAAGESIPMDDGTDHCAEDHVAAFDRESRRALEAFSEPGAMEREFKLPAGATPGSAAFGLALADAAVHGWDLAKATGQDAVIDQDIAEALYGMTSKMMAPKGPYPRGSFFGEPVDVPGDAPAQDKLVGYLGRRP